MPETLAAFATDELRTPAVPAPYEGQQLAEIAFPLGGIGTGCVSLSGRGALQDWELFNRPNKGSILPFSFCTLWTQSVGEAPQARVVQAPPQPPFTGQGGGGYRGYGFGVMREQGAGLPHMRSARFRGEFPFAEVQFEDDSLPVRVRLEAYSPFIPHEADDSGLPIAVFLYHLRNTTDAPVDLTLAMNLFNPIGYPGSGPMMGPHLGRNENRFMEEGALRGLSFTSDKYGEADPAYGSMALTTTWQEVTYQECWLRSGWFDAMHDFWDHFSTQGRLNPRALGPSAEGQSDVGTLGLMAHLNPDEEVTLPFFLTWHVPNFVKYWGESASCACEGECERPVWRNYYASQWADSLDVARYYVQNEERLYTNSRRFHEALFSSTLPPFVLDALSSQASILHSPTVLRLPDGTFYGFEGCHSEAGCCEGSCTHVWNYAQTPAFLFPSLERSLREADYTYNLREVGRMGFRLQLPLGSPPWEFHAAADGQLGGLLKLYRDWLLSGDDDWLRGLWPKAKLALEYAWQQWDTDRDGVIDGVQHNTYDIEFHGPNSMIGTFYLGALRAAEEMARHLGDTAAADVYRQVFDSGHARLEQESYNGSYYRQKVNLDTAPKYQYGEGCLADQLIGQWFAHVVGLGYLLQPEHVQSALRSVFAHNWRTDFWQHANPQRIYALNDEQGLLLCTWPNGGRPEFPFPYSDEVWCGIEYQVASHLIYEGMLEEGLAIVKGVRGRHDGVRRNPWNEFECGSHYARSMASWAVLTALTGFSFDGPRRSIGFAPRLQPEDWRSFWSTGTAWGIYSQQLEEGDAEAILDVQHGTLALQKLTLGSLTAEAAVKARLGDVPVRASAGLEGGVLTIRFEEEIVVRPGAPLTLQLDRR